MNAMLQLLLVGLICAGTFALVAFLSLLVPTFAAVLVWVIVQVLGGNAGFGATWLITTALWFLVRLIVAIVKN